MQTGWLAPRDIAENWGMNSRRENESHVESLTESMNEHGFLPKYPCIVFKTEKMTRSYGKPYVLAAGHHRLKAAVEAGLEKVFCEIHDGTEDEWIEMMCLDNFKYDASKPGVGLAFTATERKKACIHMMLLPKFLKKTNSSLSHDWGVSEQTIGRYRKEVETMIREHMEPLEKTMSPERKAQLLEILDSTTRENKKGEEIDVRKPSAKSANKQTKQKLWKDIENQALYKRRSDNQSFASRYDIRYYQVTEAIALYYELEDGQEVPDDLTIEQLTELEQLIVSEDEGFVTTCTKVVVAGKRLSEKQDEAWKYRRNVADTMRKQFYGNLTVETDKDAYYDLENQFNAMVEEQYNIDFGSINRAETLEEGETYIAKCKEILDDMAILADPFVKFQNLVKATVKSRQELRERWNVAFNEVHIARKKHLADVSELKFSVAFEKETGYQLNDMHNKGRDEKLESEIRVLQQVRTDIDCNIGWVKPLREPKETAEETPTLNINIGALMINYVETDTEGGTSDHELNFGTDGWGDHDISAIPEVLMDQLIKVVNDHHSLMTHYQNDDDE